MSVISELKIRDSQEALFDVVIPSVLKDYAVLSTCIESILKNVVDGGTIYVVTPSRLTAPPLFLFEENERVVWIDEFIFPFRLMDMSTYAKGCGNRAGWLLQQLIKFYAPFVIPGIRSRILVVDSDLILLKPTTFIESKKMQFTVGVGRHQPYFEWIDLLLPNLPTPYPGGIAHHMILDRDILTHLMSTIVRYADNKVGRTHTSDINVILSVFWRLFLEKINIQCTSGCGASEYELYYYYALKNFPDLVTKRSLNNKGVIDISSDALQCYRDSGYIFVNRHDYLKNAAEDVDGSTRSIVHIISIVNAVYGADSNIITITDLLVQRLQSGKNYLEFNYKTNTPDTLSKIDPSPGKSKNLTITYVDAKTQATKIVVLQEHGIQWKTSLGLRQYISPEEYKNNPITDVDDMFKDVYERSIWGGTHERKYYSGGGSDTKSTVAYIDFMTNYINEHKIESIVDIGCGDFRVGSSLVVRLPNVKQYVAVDTFEGVILENQRLFNHFTNVSFYKLNTCTNLPPKSDLCVIRQVLQYLSFKDISDLLKNISGQYKHIIITDGFSLEHPNDRSVNIDKPTNNCTHKTGLFLEFPPFNRKIIELLNYQYGSEIYRTIRVIDC